MEKNDFLNKNLDFVGVLASFFGFWTVRKSSKNQGNPKITGLERRSPATVFGAFLVNFKAQNTVKYNAFANLVFKDNNVKCC